MTEITERTEKRPRRFRPYPEYGDSGVEWLGKIPKHWDVGRLKDHGTLIGGAGFPHDYQGSDHEVLPFYKVGNLSTSSDGRFMGKAPHTVSYRVAAELRAHIIPAHSIIYAKIGAALLLNRRRITTRSCCIDNNMSAYVPRQRELASAWAFYWTTIVDFAALANPGAVPSLSEGDQAGIPIVIPPMTEQRSIADFLDQETAKIDGLVRRKERLIELLQEKRTALITRAVTRGLDPNVPMKDSGIEWLGETPAHWDIAPVYTRYEVALGKMLDSKQVTGDSLGKYLRNVDVQWDAVQVADLPEMDFSQSDRYRYLLRPGDLLVCEGGEVGRTAIWRGELNECFYQKAIHRMRTRSDSEIPKFFYFLMFALAQRGVFTAGGNPNTIDHLTAVQLRHYRVPFPSSHEQREIAEFLDRQTAWIDDLVSKVYEAIDHLNEFRNALISAAVTGKIEVREEAL